jgi:hypothetical protein
VALGYGPGGLSLRGAAVCAEMAVVASISGVALLKRLRGAAHRFGHITGLLLATRAACEQQRRASRKAGDLIKVPPLLKSHRSERERGGSDDPPKSATIMIDVGTQLGFRGKFPCVPHL